MFLLGLLLFETASLQTAPAWADGSGAVPEPCIRLSINPEGFARGALCWLFTGPQKTLVNSSKILPIFSFRILNHVEALRSWSPWDRPFASQALQLSHWSGEGQLSCEAIGPCISLHFLPQSLLTFVCHKKETNTKLTH